MKAKHKQSGLTLIEMTVVIAVVAVLTVFSMPAIRSFTDSLTSAGNVENLISASLASARAIAAREQEYAGVRFQQDLNGNQYIIFVVRNPQITNPPNGFCKAMKRMKPIKLPDHIGVMDLKLGSTGDTCIALDGDVSADWQITDTTTFSVVFSPSGRMVIHPVEAINKDGYWYGYSVNSADDIFNNQTIVDSGGAMFYQDDCPVLGLGRELSRNSFIIYDKEKFKQAYQKGTAYTDYLEQLKQLKTLYINPYTGTIISAD